MFTREVLNPESQRAENARPARRLRNVEEDRAFSASRALALIAARLAYDAPVIQTRVVIEVKRDSAPIITQPFMYGGIRG